MTWSLALCGLGAAMRFHRHALARLSDRFAVVAGCDPDPAARAAVEGTAYDSLETLLAEHRPDAVVVATPTGAHREPAALALRAGCAVLVEKPAVLRLEDFDALVALAGRAPLHTALHAAYAPDARWMAEQRDALIGAHGPLMELEARYHDPYVSEAGLLPRARSLGDPWIDSGINALSAIWPLVPGLVVEEVSGSPARRIAAVRFETGRGTISVDWTRGHNRKDTDLVFADGTTYRMEHNGHRVVRRGEVLLDAETPPPRLNQHYLEVLRHFDQVLGGAPDNRALSRAIHEALLSG